MLGAVGLAVVLAAAAGGLYWFTSSSPAEEQLARSTTALTATLDSLVKAETTADVRDAADAAEQAADEAAAFVAAMPADDDSPALRDVAAALTSIAAMAEVSGEHPKSWKDAEDAIRDVAEARDESLVALASPADAAADEVDAVVAKATKTYKAWVKKNAAAVAARDAAIASANSYYARMDQQLDAYSSLRNELAEYIQIVDTQGSTVQEAYWQFADASQGRRQVRDRMSALTPPDEAERAHDRLLSIIDDGIAGVEAAERALDERECTIFGCNVTEQPAWHQFRSESKRITASLDGAIADWRKAAKRGIADAEAIELPDKPDV
ncbi:MAG: hypothetical protein WCF04_09280 [Candidatus Nanopelagicales bacterium]